MIRAKFTDSDIAAVMDALSTAKLVLNDLKNVLPEEAKAIGIILNDSLLATTVGAQIDDALNSEGMNLI